jgi:hypothetical protein
MKISSFCEPLGHVEHCRVYFLNHFAFNVYGDRRVSTGKEHVLMFPSAGVIKLPASRAICEQPHSDRQGLLMKSQLKLLARCCERCWCFCSALKLKSQKPKASGYCRFFRNHNRGAFNKQNEN